MSSFICGPKHFNSIQHKLELLMYGNEFYLPYSLKNVCPKWYNKRSCSDFDIEAEIKEHLDHIRELNVLCVSLQYKHHYKGVLDDEIQAQLTEVKSQTDVKELTMLGLYNALKCVNYQIELEHLKDLRDLSYEEEKAMVFLHEITIAIGEEIIRSLPNDNTNTWEVV